MQLSSVMLAAFIKTATIAVQHRSDIVRRRSALVVAAVVLALAALAFAALADSSQKAFADFAARWPLAPLALTPVAFALLAKLTAVFAPESRGSGIPQVIARAEAPDLRAGRNLASMRTAAFKLVFTVLALGAGASVGREGPTVQVSAAIMSAVHRRFRVRVTSGIIIAGGAAGISAAFNTPLAGVAFAIEELASSYEQKLALAVMVAVMASGLVSLGIAGDYQYFGSMQQSLPVLTGLLAAPAAGVAGGLAGGLFSLVMQKLPSVGWHRLVWLRTRTMAWAGICGLVVAIAGIASGGLAWGSSYAPARSLVEGGSLPLWFGPVKLLSSLATAVAGIPGGIFAPSLATGAGLGNIIAAVFPGEVHGGIVLLGMIAYFTGVVRAPLTAVLIISEMTNSHSMILSLFLAALIADGTSALVCREKLYHALAAPFRAATLQAERPAKATDAPG